MSVRQPLLSWPIIVRNACSHPSIFTSDTSYMTSRLRFGAMVCQYHSGIQRANDPAPLSFVWTSMFHNPRSQLKMPIDYYVARIDFRQHLGRTTDVCWQPFEQQRRHFHFARLLTSFSVSRFSSNARKVPDAGECDEALGDFQAVKSRLDKLQKPSSMKSPLQIAIDAGKTLGSITITVLRFTASVPQRIRDFRQMPKEEWGAWKAGAWQTVKHEAHHYWVGTKLLWYDVKISSRLGIKAARGNELSRRERQQLTRTTADIFRLVPMIIILVIPFLEILLPFLLRIFPNMLPSTYEDKLKKEEELKRRLSIKLELAKFLQDTVAEVAKDISRRKGSGSATDLYEFINKVRSGTPVENADILRFAQLFNDELTLDNLERVQLVSMCQFVGISPFGTDSFLRSRLRSHLKKIKADDYEIEKEGLENLTVDELRAACRARGMRGPYGEGAVPFMQRQLYDWLDLSLHRGLPSSLLLLSRAFTITANVKDVAKKKDLAYEQVKQTLGVIPEEVVDKVGYETLGSNDSSIKALEQKLELLKREEALIKAELSRAAVAIAKNVTAAGNTSPVSVVGTDDRSKSYDGTPSISVPSAGPHASESISEEEKAEFSEKQRKQRVRKVIQAVMDLAARSGVVKERTLFLELIKKETDRINMDLAKSTTPAGGSLSLSLFNQGAQSDAKAEDQGEDNTPKRLSDRVSKLLTSIEKELDQVEESIGGKLHLLDTDNDGVISQQELEVAFRVLKKQLSQEDLKIFYAQIGDIEKSSEGPISIELSKLIEMARQDASVEKMNGGADAGSQDVVKIHVK